MPDSEAEQVYEAYRANSTDKPEDELYNSAVELVAESGTASPTYLQRKLSIGYARAARLIEEMEEKGVVGPFEPMKPRKVFITKK